MKKLTNFVVLAALTGLFVFAFGCSSDSDNSTGPTIVGDTSDVAYQAVGGFFEDLGVDESFEFSADFTFEMLDAQFPGALGSSARPIMSPGASGGDSSVVIISSYMYANGWHIFSFSATVFDMVNGQVVSSILVSGIDSVQVLKDGVAQQIPDSTANALTIHAQFTADASSLGFTFAGNHALGLAFNYDIASPTIVLNATITEDFSANILADTVTCTLDVTVNQTITNLTFLVDSTDEPADCPSSGSMSTVATLDLACGTATSLDSLSINGSWTMTATVLAEDNIRVTVTDGTTSWTTTEVCVPDFQATPERRFALVGRQSE